MKFNKLCCAVATCVSLTLLSGCKSTVGGSSADPRLTDEEANATYSNVTACAVGAAAVGATCLLIADSDKRAVCLAAAAAGCFVGLAGNALLENIRENYKTLEEQLNASIKVIETNNKKAKLFAARSNQVFAEDHKAFLAMQKEIKQGVIEQDKLKKTIADYDANIKLIKENIETHEAKLADYKNLRQNLIAGQKLNSNERKALANYDKRIKELQKEIESIRTVYTSYVHERDVLNLAANQGSDKQQAA